ncbi:hypothetical protein GCM10007881_13150 [Mesorhizobium huakuii]|nr:hypothetical protein GCM10007881_13150 [Mesorhizobium huakuii]
MPSVVTPCCFAVIASPVKVVFSTMIQGSTASAGTDVMASALDTKMQELMGFGRRAVPFRAALLA